MGRQCWAGEPVQHSCASAPGTAMLAQAGPVLSPGASHKRGSPAPRGRGTSPLGSATPRHVCASESSSRPSFPSRYLARSLRVTMPTTCREKGQGTAPRWHAEPGDKGSVSPTPRSPGCLHAASRDSPRCDCPQPPSAAAPGLGRA